MTEQLDMTQGPLGCKILIFSLPLILSNLLQVLFNLADVAVVGQFAGTAALGSVGSTTTLVMLFTGLVLGFASGINVLTARYRGAQDEGAVRETVHTSLLVSLLFGMVLWLIGETGARLILQTMGTKPSLIDGAVLYLRIYFMGLPPMLVFNCGSSVLAAMGDTRRPLVYLSIAGVLNIALNLLFVLAFQMSVAGVAAASAIAQLVSAVLILRAMLRRQDMAALRPDSLRINTGKARQLLALGIPSGIQNAIFQLANLFVQAGVNSFSAITVSGIAAAQNADSIAYDVMAAFYTACGSFMGQNYGAGKPDRIQRSYHLCTAYAFAAGLGIGVSVVLMGPQFLGLFTRDPAVIEQGMIRLRIMGLSYGFSAFMDCTITASRALGETMVSMVLVILGSCVFRLIWIATVFAFFGTLTSLYLLYICSWTITAAAQIIWYRRVFRIRTGSMQ